MKREEDGMSSGIGVNGRALAEVGGNGKMHTAIKAIMVAVAHPRTTVHGIGGTHQVIGARRNHAARSASWKKQKTTNGERKMMQK